MSEPTIQELIDEVIEDAKIVGITINTGMTILHTELDTSRSALLSRIMQMQQEVESSKTDYGLLSDDYKQIVISLEKAKQEAYEWHKVDQRYLWLEEIYDNLCDILEVEDNDATFEDGIIVSKAQELKDALSQHYPHADLNAEGKEVKE